MPQPPNDGATATATRASENASGHRGTHITRLVEQRAIQIAQTQHLDWSSAYRAAIDELTLELNPEEQP